MLNATEIKWNKPHKIKESSEPHNEDIYYFLGISRWRPVWDVICVAPFDNVWIRFISSKGISYCVTSDNQSQPLSIDMMIMMVMMIVGV